MLGSKWRSILSGDFGSQRQYLKEDIGGARRMSPSCRAIEHGFLEASESTGYRSIEWGSLTTGEMGGGVLQRKSEGKGGV